MMSLLNDVRKMIDSLHQSTYFGPYEMYLPDEYIIQAGSDPSLHEEIAPGVRRVVVPGRPMSSPGDTSDRARGRGSAALARFLSESGAGHARQVGIIHAPEDADPIARAYDRVEDVGPTSPRTSRGIHVRFSSWQNPRAREDRAKPGGE